MYLSYTTALLLSLASLASAAPASSRKNVYLATCTARDCLLGILCNTSPSPSTAEAEAEAANSLSAVIYYNSPATTSRSNPTDFATVSSPARSWDGTTRKVTFHSAGAFEGSIDKGATSLSKSQIAGSAKLGTEEFVCFRDGETAFKFEEGLVVETEVNCKADYWCASISA